MIGSIDDFRREVLKRLPVVGVTAVQYGTIALTGVSTNTATIASVDTTKSIVIYLGDTIPSANDTSDRCRVALTNATTVTATRASAVAGVATVSFVVLTFLTVVSLQQGTTAILTTTTSQTSTITAVAANRAILFYQGQTCGSEDQRDMARVTLTNTTTVTATRTGSGVSSTTTVGWVVVEF